MRFYSTALMLVLVVFGSRDLRAASHGFLQTGDSAYFLSPDGTTNMAQWTSISYDSKGDPIRSSTVVSNYNGFSPSYLETVTCSFDKSGELLTSITETDYNLDGTIDRRSTTTHTRLSESETQDVTESDWNNDGIIDVQTIDTQTSDERGYPIRLVTEVHINYGFPQTYTFINSWSYIEGKDSLVVVSEFDSDADGITDGITKSTQLKNKQGQLVSLADESDFQADGIIDSVGKMTFSYDKQGNPIQWTQSWTGEFGGTWVDNFSYESRGQIRQQGRLENRILKALRHGPRPGNH